MSKLRRYLSVLIALALLVSCMPVAAISEETGSTEGQVQEIVTEKKEIVTEKKETVSEKKESVSEEKQETVSEEKKETVSEVSEEKQDEQPGSVVSAEGEQAAPAAGETVEELIPQENAEEAITEENTEEVISEEVLPEEKPLMLGALGATPIPPATVNAGFGISSKEIMFDGKGHSAAAIAGDFLTTDLLADFEFHPVFNVSGTDPLMALNDTATVSIDTDGSYITLAGESDKIEGVTIASSGSVEIKIIQCPVKVSLKSVGDDFSWKYYNAADVSFGEMRSLSSANGQKTEYVLKTNGKTFATIVTDVALSTGTSFSVTVSRAGVSGGTMQQNDPVGTYDVKLTHVGVSNQEGYDIKLDTDNDTLSGAFEIKPQPVTVHILSMGKDENRSKAVGASEPAVFSNIYTLVGANEKKDFEFEDGVKFQTDVAMAPREQIQVQLKRDEGENIGKYKVSVVPVAATGAPYYPVAGSGAENGFEIKRIPVTVTLSDLGTNSTKHYSDPEPAVFGKVITLTGDGSTKEFRQEGVTFTTDVALADSEEICVSLVRSGVGGNAAAVKDKPGKYDVSVKAESSPEGSTSVAVAGSGIAQGFEITKCPVTLTVTAATGTCASKIYGADEPDMYPSSRMHRTSEGKTAYDIYADDHSSTVTVTLDHPIDPGRDLYLTIVRLGVDGGTADINDPVGKYAVGVTEAFLDPLGPSYYTFTCAEATSNLFEIKPAVIDVKVSVTNLGLESNKVKDYGDDDPAIFGADKVFTITGNGTDTELVSDGVTFRTDVVIASGKTVKVRLQRAAGEAVGKYNVSVVPVAAVEGDAYNPIAGDGLTDGFEIKTKQVTVSVADLGLDGYKYKYYGGSDPAIFGQNMKFRIMGNGTDKRIEVLGVTFETDVVIEKEKYVDVYIERAKGEDVGRYEVNVVPDKPADDKAYVAVGKGLENGFEIKPCAVTVAVKKLGANYESKIYGADDPTGVFGTDIEITIEDGTTEYKPLGDNGPMFEITVDDATKTGKLVAGNKITVQLARETTADTPDDDVGKYDVNVVVAKADQSNYNTVTPGVTLTDGFEIKPCAVKVSVKTLGDANEKKVFYAEEPAIFSSEIVIKSDGTSDAGPTFELIADSTSNGGKVIDSEKNTFTVKLKRAGEGNNINEAADPADKIGKYDVSVVVENEKQNNYTITVDTDKDPVSKLFEIVARAITITPTYNDSKEASDFTKDFGFGDDSFAFLISSDDGQAPVFEGTDDDLPFEIAPEVVREQGELPTNDGNPYRVYLVLSSGNLYGDEEEPTEYENYTITYAKQNLQIVFNPVINTDPATPHTSTESPEHNRANAGKDGGTVYCPCDVNELVLTQGSIPGNVEVTLYVDGTPLTTYGSESSITLKDLLAGTDYEGLDPKVGWISISMEETGNERRDNYGFPVTVFDYEDSDQTWKAGVDTGITDKELSMTVDNRAQENGGKYQSPAAQENIRSASAENSTSISGMTLSPEPQTFDGKTLTIAASVNSGLTAGQLPRSGSSTTMTYEDLLGYEGTLNITLTRSMARSSASVNVTPVGKGSIIGSNAAIKLYGTAITAETVIVTIGGKSYTVPISGVYTDGYNTNKWQKISDLSQLDYVFQPGQPTTITVQYDDLNGGFDSITVTYKDECKKPAVTSPLIENAKKVYGFVEEGTQKVIVTVEHTDGSVDTYEAIVDNHGYFVAAVEALEEGDIVTVTARDIADNMASTTETVESEPFGRTVAQALGANILGASDENAQAEHRFVTPVKASLFDENGELEIPVFAYTGYEVGSVTLKMDENMKVTASYVLSDVVLSPEGGAYFKTFDEIPDLATLKNIRKPVVENLADAPEGELGSFSLKPAPVEEGEEEKEVLVWIYTGFEVEMNSSMICRPNADAYGMNFYALLRDGERDEWSTDAERAREIYTLYKEFEVIADNNGRVTPVGYKR